MISGPLPHPSLPFPSVPCSGSSQDSDNSKKNTRNCVRKAPDEDSGDVLASEGQKGGRAAKKRKIALSSNSYQISEVINKVSSLSILDVDC